MLSGDSASDTDTASRTSLELCASTLALLNQFKDEEREAQTLLESLKLSPSESGAYVDMSAFKEDWQLSQFWYSQETAAAMAKEVIQETLCGDTVGFLSSPTAFVQFMQEEGRDDRSAFLFEFDERFNVFGNQFVHYDYRSPITRLSALQSKFDYLVLDPPFLAEECWYKTSETAKYLLKVGGKILVCTGMIMKEQILRELRCRSTKFKPAHAKDRLSNEFGSFINYESRSSAFAIETCEKEREIEE